LSVSVRTALSTFLDLPLENGELNAAIYNLIPDGGARPRPASSGNIIPDMTDQSILGLAINLLEQDLLRLNILKEINMVDTIGSSPGDLISSLFAIINSLYPFSSGSVLLIYENHVDFYFCGNDSSGMNSSSEIKSLILDQLKHRQDIYKGPRLLNFIRKRNKTGGGSSGQNTGPLDVEGGGADSGMYRKVVKRLLWEPRFIKDCIYFTNVSKM
jgi:hypothetical protein